jgi:hypothetical protein
MYINIFIYLVNLINFKFINLHKKRFKKIFYLKTNLHKKKKKEAYIAYIAYILRKTKGSHKTRQKKVFTQNKLNV